PPLLSLCSRLFSCSGAPRDLHSFPTRRSSDLTVAVGDGGEQVGGQRVEPAGPKVPLVEQHRLGTRRGARPEGAVGGEATALAPVDRKSTRLNSSHVKISYAVFCLKKKKTMSCR